MRLITAQLKAASFWPGGWAEKIDDICAVGSTDDDGGQRLLGCGPTFLDAFTEALSPSAVELEALGREEAA